MKTMKNLDLYKVLNNIKKEQGSWDLTYDLEDVLVGWGNNESGLNMFKRILMNYDIEIEDYI